MAKQGFVTDESADAIERNPAGCRLLHENRLESDRAMIDINHPVKSAHLAAATLRLYLRFRLTRVLDPATSTGRRRWKCEIDPDQGNPGQGGRVLLRLRRPVQ